VKIPALAPLSTPGPQPEAEALAAQGAARDSGAALWWEALAIGFGPRFVAGPGQPAPAIPESRTSADRAGLRAGAASAAAPLPGRTKERESERIPGACGLTNVWIPNLGAPTPSWLPPAAAPGGAAPRSEPGPNFQSAVEAVRGSGHSPTFAAAPRAAAALAALDPAGILHSLLPAPAFQGQCPAAEGLPAGSLFRAAPPNSDRGSGELSSAAPVGPEPFSPIPLLERTASGETAAESGPSPAVQNSTASAEPQLAFAIRLRSPDLAENRVQPAAATAPGPQLRPDAQQPPVLPAPSALHASGTRDSEQGQEILQARPPRADRLPVAGADEVRTDPAGARVAAAPAPSVPGPPVLAPDPSAAQNGQRPAAPDPVARAVSTAPPPFSSEEGGAQPVREFSIRISDGGTRSAEVRISDRGAGEVRVSVRSADAVLTTNLREGLSGLATQLDRHAVVSEIWRPLSASPQQADPPLERHRDSEGGPSPGPQGQPDTQDHGHSSSRHRHSEAPDWLEEMEPGLKTISGRYRP
jgi:hypothetical protein